MWKPGDAVVLRGIANERPWYVQSCLVVHDTPGETALLLLPGAECAAPGGYIHGKHGTSGEWDRWTEVLTNAWTLETYRWHTNRFLILLEPGKYYASMLIWEDATDIFRCYYVNFQLPFRRSLVGFDTLDLELDLVIDPDHAWHFKDQQDFERGIRVGAISIDSAQRIEAAKPEIFAKITHRSYPLDDTWLSWRPDPNWRPPALPVSWDAVSGKTEGLGQ